MTNQFHTVLYIGMTGDIVKRVTEHKSLDKPGFTSRYKATKWVYYEEYTHVHEAIEREKEIKKWSRKKKDALVNRLNPNWNDLLDDYLFG